MKKLFNNNLMRMMIALSMFAVAGCQEYSIDSQPEAAANVQDDALEMYTMAAESAANVVFNISANTPWRIEREADAQWLTVTPSMSATSSLVSEITISVEDNDTFTPRSTTLTITAEALSGYSKTITVNQLSKGDFMITELGAPVEAEGGVAKFWIYTNKAWEYIPVTDYLYGAASITSGEDTNDIEVYELGVTVPVNTGVERESKFIIRTATADYECIISQTGIELRLADGYDASNLVFEDYAGESELTFEVKANVSWDAEVAEEYADWLEITDITKTDKGGAVTVKAHGVNPYLQSRKGVVNLTASSVAPVAVTVAQPKAFSFGGNWVAGTDCIENEDGSVTINFKNLMNDRIFVSNFTGNLGTWTFEFDTERANLENAHLYFLFSTDGNETGNYYRSALTPHHNTVDKGAGIYNNFMQKNGAGWTPNGRWNFDGTQVNGTPTETNPDKILPCEAIKKLEKVTFQFALDAMTLTIYADGKVYSNALAITGGQDVLLATPFKASFRVIDPDLTASLVHGTYAGEYVTFTKVTFEPAE